MSTETELGILLKCPSAEHALAMKFLLAKVSRPDFDDDLEDWVKPLFHAVEDIDYPSTVLIVDNHFLYVDWSEFDGAVGTLFRQFKLCGLELDKAWQYADSGDFEEILYVVRDGKLSVIDAVEEGYKVPDDYEDQPENPAILQALRQV